MEPGIKKYNICAVPSYFYASLRGKVFQWVGWVEIIFENITDDFSFLCGW